MIGAMRIIVHIVERKYIKLVIAFLLISLSVAASGCGDASVGQESQNASEETVMCSIVMAYQEAGTGKRESYLYEGEEFSLELYTDQNKNTCFRINDQIFSFSDHHEYYISPITGGPVVFFYDINGDGRKDIFAYDKIIPTGMTQNTYLSCEDGGYRALGDLCWDEKSIDEYGYHVSLQNDFQVLVELQNCEIKESFPICRDFREIALELGIYEEDGTLTEYGTTWEESEIYGYKSLPCTGRVNFEVDYYGHVLISLETPVMAGYSSYELGGGFTFFWTIEEGEYQLKDISFWEAARGSFY